MFNEELCTFFKKKEKGYTQRHIGIHKVNTMYIHNINLVLNLPIIL